MWIVFRFVYFLLCLHKFHRGPTCDPFKLGPMGWEPHFVTTDCRMVSPRCTSYNLAEPNVHFVPKWQSKLTISSKKMVPRFCSTSTVHPRFSWDPLTATSNCPFTFLVCRRCCSVMHDSPRPKWSKKAKESFTNWCCSDVVCCSWCHVGEDLHR